MNTIEYSLSLIDRKIKYQEDSYLQAVEPHFSINQTVYYLANDSQILPAIVTQVFYWSGSNSSIHYRIKSVETPSWFKRAQALVYNRLQVIPSVCFPKHAVSAGDEIFKTPEEAHERLLLNDAHRSLTNLVESEIFAHPSYNGPLTISDIGALEDQISSV